MFEEQQGAALDLTQWGRRSSEREEVSDSQDKWGRILRMRESWEISLYMKLKCNWSFAIRGGT